MRLAELAAGNNQPVIAVPLSSMVASFITYHRLKVRGGRLVGGQTVEDIISFALDHKLTENTARNRGGCIDLHSDITRDEPFFALLMTTNGLLEETDLTAPVETDETYKLIYEGYPVTVIGQSDMNRNFHVR